jgi:hypothetical protein
MGMKHRFKWIWKCITGSRQNEEMTKDHRFALFPQELKIESANARYLLVGNVEGVNKYW